MVIVVLVALGLIFGSFVNAAIWRLHEQDKVTSAKKVDKARLAKLSISRGRSMCSHCGHPLASKDLIPLFSWLWLRGKCRYCHTKIEDSPLIELMLPLLFVVSYMAWPQPFHGFGLISFVFWLVFLTGFIALTAYDLRWYLLPDKIVFPLIGLAAVQVLVSIAFYHGGVEALLGAVWGVLIASGIFYALFQLSGGKWIGGGDVKLGLVIGLLVGGPSHAILVLFLSSFIGLLWMLPLLLSGKAKRDTRLPFGPFLILATVITVLWGSWLISTYERLLLF
jgi:leader peptidase (prepilin peptidase)/N-methyltransferase